jgi:MHS family alpha-ketoglutarate permease-like MFS transporter
LTAISLILQQILDESQLREWGWRIPFVIGAFAAVIALLLRKTLSETASNVSKENRDAGSIRALFRDHKKAFFTVLGYTAGGSLSFYTFTTYMQKYLVNSANMSINTASAVMTGCLLKSVDFGELNYTDGSFSECELVISLSDYMIK